MILWVWSRNLKWPLSTELCSMALICKCRLPWFTLYIGIPYASVCCLNPLSAFQKAERGQPMITSASDHWFRSNCSLMPRAWREFIKQRFQWFRSIFIFWVLQTAIKDLSQLSRLCVWVQWTSNYIYTYMFASGILGVCMETSNILTLRNVIISSVERWLWAVWRCFAPPGPTDMSSD